MEALSPFETLVEGQTAGPGPSWPAALSRLFGPLAFPAVPGRLWVAANFASTLDGVVTYAAGRSGGGPVSGFSSHDAAHMALLRCLADAVLLGAGSLRVSPQKLLTAQDKFPALAGEFTALRKSLGKPAIPLHVYVTGRGGVDYSWRVFQTPEIPVLVVAAHEAAEKLEAGRPGHVTLCRLDQPGLLDGGQVLACVRGRVPEGLVLLEGGPTLHSSLLEAGLINDLFLTLSPRVAGRDPAAQPRPGFSEGRAWLPEDSPGGRLESVKRAGEHLFLRYRFRN